MAEPASQVLNMSMEMGTNELDLHVVFESAGNDPGAVA